MTYFAVTAARFQGERLVAVKMGELEPGKDYPAWRTEPVEVLPHEVVDRLMGGDTVLTIYIVEGHRVAGPKLKRALLGGGIESIELEQPGHSGRTLRDLPAF